MIWRDRGLEGEREGNKGRCKEGKRGRERKRDAMRRRRGNVDLLTDYSLSCRCVEIED